jgi:hypothetical protein
MGMEWTSDHRVTDRQVSGRCPVHTPATAGEVLPDRLSPHIVTRVRNRGLDPRLVGGRADGSRARGAWDLRPDDAAVEVDGGARTVAVL